MKPRHGHRVVAACLPLLAMGFAPSLAVSGEVREVDLLIVGGGVGGCAAALQACAMAGDNNITSIALVEPLEWIGGQYTTQGVCATDPNGWTQGGNYGAGSSRLYHDFHERIRDMYRPRAREAMTAAARMQSDDGEALRLALRKLDSKLFSPGNPWGNRMAFLPRDGVAAFNEMLAPYVESGLLEIRLSTVPIEADTANNTIRTLTFRDTITQETVTYVPQMTIDATEQGDLFPLAGIDYKVGIEASADTMEPSLFDADGNELYPEPIPDCIQSWTYTFALEWGEPGTDNRLPWEERPASYERYRSRYTISYFLMARSHDFAARKRFEESGVRGRIPTWWAYRRIYNAEWFDTEAVIDLYPYYLNGTMVTDLSISAAPRGYIPSEYRTTPGDIITVNFSSNDYSDRNLIDVSEEEKQLAIEEAKEQALGYLFYLWYEVPRDPLHPIMDRTDASTRSIDPATGMNTGYANLIFRKDVMGTDDGFSMFPYIRESRRIDPMFQVRQQHIMGSSRDRADHFNDSVGTGSYYYMDIHDCDYGQPDKVEVQWKPLVLEDGRQAMENSLRPFQIPLGALIPKTMDGFLAGAKNLGVTHITNGAYRLQPVEFQIGQAAGAAAALALGHELQPRDFWTDERNPLDPSSAERRLRRLQWVLLQSEVPIFWNTDAGWDTDHFRALQFLCQLQVITPSDWLVSPGSPLTAGEVSSMFRALGSSTRTGASAADDEIVSAATFVAALNDAFGAHLSPGGEEPITRSQGARLMLHELLKCYQITIEAGAR